MAFDFMDIIPDSPAAVKASEGARSILENRYKQAMDSLALENALMQSAKQQVAFNEDAKMQPLAKTVDSIKLLQGLNTPTINTTGLDFQDPNAVNEFILKQPVTTNMGADLMKLKAQEDAAISKAMATKSVTQDNWEAKETLKAQNDAIKTRNKEAMDHLAALEKRYPRTLSPGASSGKLTALAADYWGLERLGNPVASEAFYRKHATALAKAGVAPPNGAPASKAPAAQAPQAKAEPKTYTSKSGKKYLIEGGSFKEI